MNNSKHHTWNSTPLINIIQPLADNSYRKAIHDGWEMHIKCNPAVKKLKEILGRQKYTWIGWVRNYVWEGENWRIYGSTRGVSVEIREGMSVQDSWAAWDDAMRSLGVNPLPLEDNEAAFDVWSKLSEAALTFMKARN